MKYYRAVKFSDTLLKIQIRTKWFVWKDLLEFDLSGSYPPLYTRQQATQMVFKLEALRDIKTLTDVIYNFERAFHVGVAARPAAFLFQDEIADLRKAIDNFKGALK